MKLSDIALLILILAMCCLGCGQVETVSTLLPTDAQSTPDDGNTRGETSPTDVYQQPRADIALPETVSKPPPNPCNVPAPDKPYIQTECKPGCAMCQVQLKSDPTSHPQLSHCQLGNFWCVPSCEVCS